MATNNPSESEKRHASNIQKLKAWNMKQSAPKAAPPPQTASTRQDFTRELLVKREVSSDAPNIQPARGPSPIVAGTVRGKHIRILRALKT